MNYINLANHLQNLIYYKDEYRLFYPRTPADIRHNITEPKKARFFWKRALYIIMYNTDYSTSLLWSRESLKSLGACSSPRCS